MTQRGATQGELPLLWDIGGDISFIMVQMIFISLNTKGPRLDLYWHPSCGEAGGLHHAMVARFWSKTPDGVKQATFCSSPCPPLSDMSTYCP